MKTSTLAHPPVVSRSGWLMRRKALLAEEKELTKQRDHGMYQLSRLSSEVSESAELNHYITLTLISEAYPLRQKEFNEAS